MNVPVSLDQVAHDIEVTAPDAERLVELLRGLAELYRAPVEHRARVLRAMVRGWA